MSSQSGFTLVELMVASVMLSISLLAILSVFTTSRSSQTYAAALQQAYTIADSEIERQRALDFASLIAGTTTTTQRGLPGGSMIVKVEPYPSGSIQYLRRITVTVSWSTQSEAIRKTGSVTEETLVARP